MSKDINIKDLRKQESIRKYEELKKEMISKGYKENIGTISIAQANIYTFLTAAPIAVICFIIYISIWNNIHFEFTSKTLIIFLFLMIACFVIHELLHGITWSFFCENKMKSIHFGVMLDSLTPYCHCDEPLNFKGYITGGLMPLFILGILMFIVSLFMENSFIMILSLINILCAGGDTTIAVLLLKYRNALFVDHPTDCGFIAFTK